MAVNKIQEGKRIEITAAADIKSGALVMIQDLAAVALVDIATGAKGNCAVDEVWELSAKANVAIAQGDKLYWNPTGDPYQGTVGSGCVTNVATGASYIGIAWAAAGATALTVRCKLNA